MKEKADQVEYWPSVPSFIYLHFVKYKYFTPTLLPHFHLCVLCYKKRLGKHFQCLSFHSEWELYSICIALLSIQKQIWYSLCCCTNVIDVLGIGVKVLAVGCCRGGLWGEARDCLLLDIAGFSLFQHSYSKRQMRPSSKFLAHQKECF